MPLLSNVLLGHGSVDGGKGCCMFAPPVQWREKRQAGEGRSESIIHRWPGKFRSTALEH